MNYTNYRIDDIKAKTDIMGIYPLDVMVTGVTGAGKSTTLNSLFEKTVAKVGTGVEPETMELGDYRLNNVARFWDTPGLGDGIQQDRRHVEKIVDLLYKISDIAAIIGYDNTTVIRNELKKIHSLTIDDDDYIHAGNIASIIREYETHKKVISIKSHHN